MADITTSEVNDIGNAKFRQIGMRIVRELELTIEKVACNRADPARWPLGPSSSTEGILAARFKALPALIQDIAATKAKARVLDSAPAVRAARFGDLSSVNLTISRPIDAQVREFVFPSDLKITAAELTALAAAPRPAPAPALNKLEFRIHGVKCLDETDGFLGSEAGSDEISLGGNIVDETGDTEAIAPFKVGSFGSDGNEKTFSPPRVFATFDMREGSQFPKSYFTTLVLAEVDMGGLPDFVNKLLDKVKEKVTSALASAIGAGIGSAGGLPGALIGALVGMVVAEAFKLLRNVWNDDIFAPVTLEASIPSFNHRFSSGGTESTKLVADFAGHGGRYIVRYDWRVFA